MTRVLLGGDGRLRAGWRILLYLALLVLLHLAAGYLGRWLPRAPLGWTSYVLLIAVGLLAGWALLVRFDGRPPGALGFALTRATLPEIVTGFGIGAALLVLAALPLFGTDTVHFEADSGDAGAYLASLTLTLGFFALAAAFEEVWFRGYAFQALVEGIGVWPAILLSSALFSFFHADNPNVDAIALANIFLAGILLALAYLRTRSLWFATAVHAGWNWTMSSALGFPVSGLVMLDTPMYDTVETGPDWWTGGAFGPEAGIVGTAAMIAGIAWLLRTGRLREPDEVRTMRPLVDARIGERWP